MNVFIFFVRQEKGKCINQGLYVPAFPEVKLSHYEGPAEVSHSHQGPGVIYSVILLRPKPPNIFYLYAHDYFRIQNIFFI